MEPTVLSAIVIAIGSLIVALITRSQNRAGAKATNALTERVVDREDFKEVMTRMEDALARSDSRVDQLEKKLVEESRGRYAAEERAARAEERAVKLERRVTLLELVLTSNKIPIPTD